MNHSTQKRLARAITRQKINLFNSTENLFQALPKALDLEAMIEAHLPAYRERYFTPMKTFYLFLHQMLSSDKSCQQTVLQHRLIESAQGKAKVGSSNTSAYCQARQRLPFALINETCKKLGQWLQESSPSSWRWCNRTVKLVDGTTVSMPDTPENQKHYPQQAGQKPGLGFPIARLLTLICLDSGAILSQAIGDYRTSEHALFRTMLEDLSEHDVVVGDRYFGTYFLIAALKSKKIDGVFKMSAMRHYDFRKGKQLESKDHLVVWKKPPKPQWLDKTVYDNVPDELMVREVKQGTTVLVTTLHHHKEYPKEKLMELYRLRWQIELDFRAIKSVMNMDILRSKSPEMVEKEIAMHLLAYNLIRLLMMQSAALCNKAVRQLSFKVALQGTACFLLLSRLLSLDKTSLCYKNIIQAINQHTVKIDQIGESPER